MKRTLLSVMFTLIVCMTASAYDLSGNWTLRQADDPHMKDIRIKVPGDVHSALLDAGLISDPHIGTNEFDNLWVGRKDWIVSRQFEVDSRMLSAEAVYLRAEDVDTFCDISINGKPVGKTSNRFRRWEWDVKPYLKPGVNTIEGYFHSAEIITEERGRSYSEPYPMSAVGLVPDINLIRKPACHGGWDWGLCQMTTGFAGKVQLIPVNVARLDYVMCDQDHSVKGRCQVNVNVELTSPSGGSTSLEIRFNGEAVRKKVTLNAGHNVVSHRFLVKKPKLWWPNGMGGQNLYDLEVKIEGSSLSKKIALRTIEVVNVKDIVYGKEGMSMSFKVNGEDFFAKGADWVPCDIFETRQTRARYRDVLTSAKEANMNMLRHWGGGQFERDDYYELCDSLGLMIWHDFMFSCAVYPADQPFLDEIEAELNHQLRRLRDYGCIAMWCGDNECVGALGWFESTKANRAFYTSNLDKIIKLRDKVCKEVDPARVYWPSSPCAGPGDYQTDNWKEDTKGDMHLWSVSKFSEPLQGYYNVKPRFCSEYGHSSFSSLALIKRFCTSPEQVNPCSPEFESHIKETPSNGGKLGNQIIFERLYLHFNFPSKVEDVFYLSQVEQAMGLKTASEFWRTLEPNCMGTIYWQLNDIWPAATSWSTIEYDGKWKLAHYNVKRFFAQEIISAVPSREGDGGLDIWAINDTRSDKSYTVNVICRDFAGARIWEENLPVVLSKGHSENVISFAMDRFGNAGERKGRFVELNLLDSDGSVAAYNFWMFDEFKYTPLQEASVRMTPALADGRWTVTLTTDRPAFYVWVQVPDVAGEFDDNAFTLYPDEPRTIVFSPKEDVAFDDFAKNLSLTHMSMTY